MKKSCYLNLMPFSSDELYCKWRYIFSGKSDTTVAQKQLTQYLLKVADGNFLYLRMTLDLMDQEVITPKSAGFTTVPTDLCQVSLYSNKKCSFRNISIAYHDIFWQLFLLQCNLRFRSNSSFDEFRDVISVALASLYPLKDEQLYQAVCSDLPHNALPWPYFKQQMEILDELLVQNPSTGGRAFFHPLFREWLMGLIVPSQGTSKYFHNVNCFSFPFLVSLYLYCILSYSMSC